MEPATEKMYWNEDGERVFWPISSSDATIDDIPRVMREHRDLRRALDKAVLILKDLPLIDGINQRDLEFILRIRSKNPI